MGAHLTENGSIRTTDIEQNNYEADFDNENEDEKEEKEEDITDENAEESFSNALLSNSSKVYPTEYKSGTFQTVSMVPFFALKHKISVDYLYRPQVFLWISHLLVYLGLNGLRYPEYQNFYTGYVPSGVFSYYIYVSYVNYTIENGQAYDAFGWESFEWGP
ncbi:hypothetical protein BDF21DRAFT_400074 [Thamnidium elegans]|nr:hypothetical protein BDF21DRAFT_400074 [Thamnidium elegans]